MKKLIVLLFCALFCFNCCCFAAEIKAQTTDKQVKTEIVESTTTQEKQNITIININRTWFCFINKGFKTSK